ncbi:MAG: tRNA (adenosine(37)-N6)-threonylcarbamoyltransferase complex dimerization subunit type 1 TsaB [Fimbriimonas sp.]
MIVGFSTSSAWSSVAALARDGTVLWQAQEHAPQRAGEACVRMLRQMLGDVGGQMADVELFAADVGPGSFTGVRVGVVLAKTFAWSEGKLVAGADAFDLISPSRTVVLPSKKGEFFIRVPGEAPYRDASAPDDAVGYGPDRDPNVPPHAAGFGALVHRLEPVDPLTFAPAYLIEPSISIPKKAYRAGNDHV